MKRIFWYILVIAITLAILLLLWQFSIAIILFALSLVVSAGLKPLINRIAEKSRSKRFALSTVYFMVIAFILSFLAIASQFILQDLQKASDDFAASYEDMKTEWPDEGSIFQRALAEQLPASNDLYGALTSEEGILSMTQNGWPGRDFFSILGYIAIILVLSIYWSTDQLRFERISVSLFPVAHRPKVLHVWRAVEEGVGAYLRSELVQSILAGLLLGAGYWALGIRYPTLLALWGAIVRLIPWFGVLIAVIPFLFLGGSLPFSGLLAILYTTIVLVLLRIAIGRLFIDHRRDNSPLLIILFVFVLAEAFGVVGVLLTPPLAVTVQILIQELSPLVPRRYSQELEKAFTLKKRLSHVRKYLKNPTSSESMQWVNRLNQLVRQAITYMQKY